MSTTIERPSRATDADVLVLKICVRALDKSTSRKMLRASLEYLRDRYLLNPSKELPEHLKSEQP